MTAAVFNTGTLVQPSFNILIKVQSICPIDSFYQLDHHCEMLRKVICTLQLASAGDNTRKSEKKRIVYRTRCNKGSSLIVPAPFEISQNRCVLPNFVRLHVVKIDEFWRMHLGIKKLSLNFSQVLYLSRYGKDILFLV